MQKTEKTTKPVDKLRNEISSTLDVIDGHLAKLEIMTAAMAAFTKPIPDYDFSFQHQRHLTASATVLRRPRTRNF